MRIDRQLLTNLASLYGSHVVSLFLPLLLWTRLSRELGPAAMGHLAIAEATARYIALVIEFGYQFSATRDIAQSQSQPEARNAIVRSVISGQLLLSAAMAVVLLAVLALMPSLRREVLLAVSALAWGVSLGLNPSWYFQGSERLSWATGVDLVCRSAGVLLILFLVRAPGDVWLASALSAMAASLSASICWRRVARETAIGRLRLSEGWNGLVSGVHLFVFRGVVSLYTTANVLLLGILGRPEAVAFFAAAEKLARAGVSALYPVSQAMFPRIARLLEVDRLQARAALRVSLRAALSLGVLIGAGLALCSRPLVSLLYGPAFLPSAEVLIVLSGLAPLIAISNVFGLQWMLPQRMERALNAILACGALFGVLLAVMLVPAYQALGMAVAVLGAESLISSAIVVHLFRGRLKRRRSPVIREELAKC